MENEDKKVLHYSVLVNCKHLECIILSICSSELALDVVLGYENKGCVAFSPQEWATERFHIPNWGCFMLCGVFLLESMCSSWAAFRNSDLPISFQIQRRRARVTCSRSQQNGIGVKSRTQRMYQVSNCYALKRWQLMFSFTSNNFLLLPSSQSQGPESRVPSSTHLLP